MQFKQRFYIFLALVLLSNLLVAQTQKEWTVGIFLQEGIELLDFAGPGEVFAASGFKVYTIGTTTNPITSQGFLKVVPDYSIKNAPTPDILVIGGGGTSNILNSEETLAWIKKMSTKSEMMFSVCTGAGVLAKIGLLDGKKATTYHGYLDKMEMEYLNVDVLHDVRFVDNGKVITTAGVSAGIDGALHMIAKLKDVNEANSVARYMEYESWNPNAGMIMPSRFEKEVAAVGMDQAIQAFKAVKKRNPDTRWIYHGEVLEYAQRLGGKPGRSGGDDEKILEFGVAEFGPSVAMYEALGNVYRKGQKPAPPTEESFMEAIIVGNVDAAVTSFAEIQSSFPKWLVWDESRMNKAGYKYLEKNEMEDALKLFKLNVDAYPNSFHVYDSYAETLAKSGDKAAAISNYEKSLKLNPGNVHATQELKKLR